ncbi:MAG: hypothetical protein E6I76_09145 [Chloroflexi bacterium]|nr:MAG: hypothetical protein E6I76_09145 [Chloroflexota bacterium]
MSTRRPSSWRQEVEWTTAGRNPREPSAATTTGPGSKPEGNATCQEAASGGRRVRIDPPLSTTGRISTSNDTVPALSLLS